MLLLPQCNFRALFSLAVCITTICSLRAIAVAQNQPVRTPSSHVVRSRLTCVTTKLQLGDIAVGQTSNKLATITNSGRTPLIVLSAKSTGTEFGLNGMDLPLTLAAGETFTFPVTFAPQRIGLAEGSISIVSGAPEQTLTIELTGTGRAPGHLQVSPAVIDFGDGNLEPTGTQRGQLTASGANVTVSSATIGSEDFQLGGLSLPVTIPAGHSVPFTVTLVPHNSSSSTILSFASDADNSLTEQAATVHLVKPAQHKVLLSWKPSTSKHILGYNVYRGNQSGGPYQKINGVLDPNTKFTDLKVNSGQKYYYVATAVNSRKKESRHSKQIRVAIP
jgi:hypothetical protein